MPEDGNPNEFLRDHDGLLHKGTAVLSHVLQDHLGSLLADGELALGGHCQGVDECLAERGGTQVKSVYWLENLSKL